MGATFSYPFRVLPNGAVATVDTLSDEGIRQAIAAIVLTQLGERVLAPSFGLPDPTFSGIEPSQLAAAISVYGPDVSLDSVKVVARDQRYQKIEVRYNETVVVNAQS